MNSVQKDPLTTAEKLKLNSKKCIYYAFDIDKLGGWKNFSNRLHQEYCMDDSTIFLGRVCPNCKGNDFSLSWGTYKNIVNCPDCECQLESFWSETRTKHRFTQQAFPLGVLAFHNDQLVGFTWGFEKTIPTEKASGFYIEMVVLDKQYRNSRMGLSAMSGMFSYLENALQKHQYPYIFVRTFKIKNQVSKWLGIQKYNLECACPEDANRVLFMKPFMKK